MFARPARTNIVAAMTDPSVPTHCLQTNGGTIDELLPLLDPRGALHRALAGLDGTGHFAVSLWRLPEGKRLWDELSGSWPFQFLQAAGSAQRMMVEVRQSDERGQSHLYRLQRSSSGVDATTGIQRGAYREQVAEQECFIADEAATIFWHYYEHGTVPQSYDLRVLE